MMHELEIVELLRAKREEEGLSLGDVADKLKISEETMRKIDEGRFDELPGRVFVRGYLRYYAKLLNLDVATMFDDEESLAPPPMMDNDLDYAQNETVLRLTRVWGSVAVAVIFLALGYAWWSEGGPPEGTPPADTPSEADAAPEGAPSEADAAPEGAPPEADAAPEGAPPEVNAPTAEPAWAPPQPERSFDEEVPQPPDEPAPVEEFEFDAEPGARPGDTGRPASGQPLMEIYLEIGGHESWVRVIDAEDNSLIEALLPPGETRRLFGIAPFDFRIGYVSGVTLLLNGEAYDLLRYEDREVAIFSAP